MKDAKIKSEMEVLQELTKPVVEWLLRNHDPYTVVSISQDMVTLNKLQMGIPTCTMKIEEVK